MREQYKFERFRDPDFPVYTSQQSGARQLVKPHFHKAAELIRIMQGSVTIYIQAHRYSCTEGDLIFIPPMTVHSAVSEDPAAVLRGLTYELSLIRAEVYGVCADTILSKTAVNEHVFPPNACPLLEKAMLQAVEAYIRNGPTVRLELLSALYGVTAELVKLYFHNHEAYETYDRLQPVITYLNNHYRKDISLAELSQIINVCDDHLIRLFKAATNKTPIRYLTDLRLQEVLKLLIMTDLPISEIAARVGFSSVNYLSRVFRSSLSMTPSEYRKSRKTPP